MRSRTALVTVVTTLGLLVGGTPAVAGTWRAPDPVRDVAGTRHVAHPKPCGTDTPVDATDVSDADITGLKVRNQRRAVRIGVGMREVTESGDHGLSLRLRTPRGDFLLSVSREQGDVITSQPMQLPPDLDEAQTDECGGLAFTSAAPYCDGVTASYLPGPGRIEVEIRHRCLPGARSWVRVGVSAFTQVGKTWFIDTWGPRGATYSLERPVLGRRVRAAR